MEIIKPRTQDYPGEHIVKLIGFFDISRHTHLDDILFGFGIKVPCGHNDLDSLIDPL